MIQLGLVEKENEYVRLTLLGRACGNSALSFESSLRLVELLRAIGSSELTAEKLMAVVQALPESGGGYTPLMKRGRAEANRPREVSEKYGSAVVHLLQRFVDDEADYLARCKRAAILWDWIHGEPLDQIERHYSPNPIQGRIGHGDIRRFADSTRYHLRSAHQIMSVLFVEGGPSVESVEKLLKQLELGIPADALGLTDLPVQLSRGEYLTLFSRGMAAVSSVWTALKGQLEGILGKTRIDELKRKQPSATSDS